MCFEVIKILSQPCLSRERNWNAFETANTNNQNNLLPSRLSDLVFIIMNMHLHSMTSKIKQINAGPIYIDHVNPFGNEENV